VRCACGTSSPRLDQARAARHRRAPTSVWQRDDALDTTSRSAPTATRSTRASRSWSTPAAASSASSARREKAGGAARAPPARRRPPQATARRPGRRPGRPRGRDDARRLDVGRRRPQAARRRDRGAGLGEIELESARLEARHGSGAAGHPRRRRARRVAEDRLPALGISPTPSSARTRRRSPGHGGSTIVLALAARVGLFFVVPVGATSLIKGQVGVGDRALDRVAVAAARHAADDLARPTRTGSEPSATARGSASVEAAEPPLGLAAASSASRPMNSPSCRA
jgi:hypothetical protein